MQVRERTLLWLLTTAVSPLLVAASCQPKIDSFSASPALVCPGDTIVLQLRAENYEGGRFTAEPAPLEPAFPIPLSGSKELRSESLPVRVCEPGRFDATIWNGEEADCGEGLTVCSSTRVSVVDGDTTITRTLVPCFGPVAGQATLSLSDRDYSDAILVREVANCGARTVTVSHDGAEARLDPGDSTGAFGGHAWTGDWMAAEVVLPAERCPFGEVRDVPPAPAPPPICLTFAVGCPDAPDCG